MKLYKYSILAIMMLFMWQSVEAQSTQPLNNGRTAAQEARQAQTNTPDAPTATKAAARNGEEGEDLGDEGQYADRPSGTDEHNLDAINGQLQGFAEKFNNLELTNEQLQTELENVKKSLNMCCGSGSSLNGLSTGTLIDEETPYLMQNAPNPFNEETRIQFFIPYNANIANLEIRDLSGKVLKTFSLEGRGLSDVKVNRKAFESGSYIYTLEVDGQIKDSKIMILTR